MRRYTDVYAWKLFLHVDEEKKLVLLESLQYESKLGPFIVILPQTGCLETCDTLPEIARFRAIFPLSIKADTANQSERSR